MAADLYLVTRRPIFGAGQSVSYTGSSAKTTKLPTGTLAVSVVLTTAGYVKVGRGASLAATTSDLFLNAGERAIIPVPHIAPSDTDPDLYVAAIQDSSNGTMKVQPFAD